MSVRDTNISKTARVAEQVIPIALITAVGKTDEVAFKFTPGYRYEVVRITTFNSKKTDAVAGKVKIGTRQVADLVFSDETEVAQSLSATLVNRRGSAAEALSIEYTSQAGTGALSNGYVVIVIRPWPLSGEVAVGRNSPG